MKEQDIRPRSLFDTFLRLSKEDINEFFGNHSRRVYNPCPACDEQAAHKKVFIKNDFTYVECLNCGTLYANPRPTEASINRYYKESRAIRYWADHFFKETEDARRQNIFKPKAVMIVDLLIEASNLTKMNKLLDAGMGYGVFAEEIARLNYFDLIVGIEPSPHLAAICKKKGFPVINKPMEMVQHSEYSHFSAAVSFEVIEHLYSPERFLRSINSLLASGGFIVLTTLNINGFDLLALWDNSDSISPPHHINFFNLESIAILLARAGFRVIKSFTPGELDVDIVKNNSTFVHNNRFIHYLVSKSSSQVQNNFQTFLQQNNLSSHMCILAQSTKC